MQCSNHPRYRGVRKSTTGCVKCAFIHVVNELRKALGFSHAVAKPRLVKTPNFAANLAEPTEAVRAERKARAIEFQKAMSNEDTKTNP